MIFAADTISSGNKSSVSFLTPERQREATPWHAPETPAANLSQVPVAEDDIEDRWDNLPV